ncbi:MAG: hypothetical protein AB1634_03175 [Thermodesulfobacteriota bacterium]
MENHPLTYPFEVPFEEVRTDPERFVSSVFACLASEFLVMPKGDGFVDYPLFEQGYEALKRATRGFAIFSPTEILSVARSTPIALIVLRAMLGFTPPEWAYAASQYTEVAVSQGAARSLDRRIRMTPTTPLRLSAVTAARVQALVTTACRLLTEGGTEVASTRLHRLDKADTRNGTGGMRRLADLGVPYAMLLYERFLGRPFAGHRDSVSELVGDALESAIEEILAHAGISFRKTRRAERIPGFDQTPDFMIPSEFNPQVIIEAKITEDDGTARDKVTRIQHLGQLSLEGQSSGRPRFEVVACIAGRGFGVRREDMKKMLLATFGKVFTLRNLDRLVECTRLREFRTT